MAHYVRSDSAPDGDLVVGFAGRDFVCSGSEAVAVRNDEARSFELADQATHYFEKVDHEPTDEEVAEREADEAARAEAAPVDNTVRNEPVEPVLVEPHNDPDTEPSF